jgi:CDP-6-deoxy-D-xylo-4-hexulose-3-dehydrase
MSKLDQYKPGSIQIYKVPSLDSSHIKPRPVLITSLPNSEGDVLGILGHTQIQNWIAENQLVINKEDLISGSLPKATIFPASKQMIFSPKLFCGEVGTVSPQTLEKMMRMVIGHQVEQFESVVRKPKAFEPGKSVIPPSGKVIGALETKYMIEAALDGWLTTGRFNEAFENRFAEFVGVPYALTTNSGSSANLLAMTALTSPKLGERALKPGDEVITVAAGFPTTVNPILQTGMVPVFVDIDIPTYNIDPKLIEAAVSSRTKAIMIAHTLGNPFDLDSVMALARKYGLWVIEDCCDALGSIYKGQHVGTFGDIATCSFYPAHHITMGEGGMIFTKDRKLSKIIESFRDWGRDCYCPPGHDNTCGMRFGWQLGGLPKGYDHKYIYSHLGYNLKITDMQAACALAQMDKLADFIEVRKKNFEYLKNHLKCCDQFFILPDVLIESKPCWFGFPITLQDSVIFSRVDLLKYLNDLNIGTRLLFSGNITRQPYMVNAIYKVSGELKNTDTVMNNSFWIGVYPGLDTDILDYVVSKLKEFFNISL